MSQVRGLNNRGEVAGGNGSQARLYSGGVVTNIGALVSGTSIAVALNDNGQVVVRSPTTTDPRSRYAHVFLYGGGTMTDLDTPGDAPQPTAINNNGEVVGYFNGTYGSAAVQYRNGAWNYVLEPGHSYPTYAYGINDGGQIALNEFDFGGYLFSGGVRTGVGFSVSRQAGAINQSGQIVGWTGLWTFDTNHHAFLYGGGVRSDLGTLGGTWSEAYAINNTGQIVGSSTASNGTIRAFIYSEGKMTDLNSAPDLMVTRLEWDTIPGALTFTYTNSVVPVGTGQACSPIAINDQGQILCSGGLLLTPVASTSTSAKLFWATGTATSNRISNTEIFTHPIPAGFTGGSAPIQVPTSSLQNRPTNATHVLLVLNPDNQLLEVNTNNNTAALNITQPDLLASALAWNPPDDGLYFAYTVQPGTIPRVPTTAELFWANGTAISNKVSSALFTHGVPASFEGQSSNINAPASVFSNPPTNATHVLLVVDSPKLVAESSENNNVAAVVVTRPDLAPAYLQWAATGDALDFAYTIQPGNTPRGSTTAKLFWANGPAASNLLSITPLFTTNIAASVSGQSSNITVSATNVYNPPTNATHVLLILDPDRLVAESNETNNSLALVLCDSGSPVNGWTAPDGGQFLDAQNWSQRRVPASCNFALFTNSSLPYIYTVVNCTNFTETKTVRRIEFRDASWDLKMNPSFRLAAAEDLTVKSGVDLLIEHGFLKTPKLTLEPGSILWAHRGGIEVDGDWKLATNSDLSIRLSPTEVGGTTPLIKVAANYQFRAAGKIHFQLATGYNDPKPGDRFRLIEFKAETTDVNLIYDWYRFKDYDPTIPGHDDLIWGLAYRQEGGASLGAQFIELLVMRKPRRFVLGAPLSPSSTKNGLVFITHGTASEISNPQDGGFGEIADGIQTFLNAKRLTRWDVAVFNWAEFSTAFEDATYNAATSAQVGIGLAESLAHWLKFERFGYSDMHLLSHSSGCWQINRLSELSTATSKVHLTFFDAFVNPSETLFLGLFGGRFKATLGGKTDGDDFVEHYVEKQLLPPGTSDVLPNAVNFDVTSATIPSDPFATADQSLCWALLLANRPLGLACLIAATGPAHAWPYKWYLETIRFANGDPHVPDLPAANCAGFMLSSEFLEATSQQPQYDPIRKYKETIDHGRANGREIRIVGRGCGKESLAAIRIQHPTQFTNLAYAPVGTYGSTPQGGVSMTTGTGVAAGPLQGGNGPLPGPPPPGGHQWAAVTNSVFLPHSASEFAFDYQFSGSSTGMLTVIIDGTVAGVLDQSLVGTNLLTAGPLPLEPELGSGPHTLVFLLESTSDEPAAIALSNLQFGYDPRPLLKNERVLSNGNVQMTLQGVPNRVYAIEGALVITGPWNNLGTALVGTNGLGIFIDTNTPSPSKFYRASAAQPSVSTSLQNLTNLAGNSLTLAASVSGTPMLYFQWLKDGVLIVGATNSTLLFSSLTTNDSGHYSIAVSNSHGVVESAIANLTVLMPAPAMDFTAPGGLYTDASYSMGFEFDALQAITVTALGMFDDNANGFAESHDVGIFSINGTLLASTTVFSTNQLIGYFRYQHIPPLNLPAGSGYRVAAVTGTERYTWAPSGPTTNALIRFVGARHTANTTNLVFPTGSDPVLGYFGANLLLTTSAALPDLPVITTQPTNRNAALGAAATFVVAATGTAPLAYQWRRDGVNLNDATNIGGATTSTLGLANVTAFSAGNYDVVVANSYGSVTSRLASLSVFLPTLRLGPVSRGADAFSTGVSGTPGDTVWILRSLKLVPPWTPIGTVTFGANGMAMFVDTNPPASSAFYRASPVLPVLPVITTQPTNRNAVGGATVTFTVVANGAAPLGYFWRKRGAALSNYANLSGAASPTLAITNLQFTDSGNYDVVVTNYYGGVTSQVASLTVAISDPPTAAMDFTAPGGLYTDASYSMGFEFDALQAITVTALGMFDDNANGFAESHDVGIFSINGTLLASTTIFSTNQLISYFRYQQIPPLNLPAGSGYRVAAVTGTERYTWAPSGPTTNALIRFVGARHTANTTNLVFPTGSDAVLGYFGANFLLTVSTNQPP